MRTSSSQFKNFRGFGGFNQANQAAILQQQIADQIQTQNIFKQIGYVPQGGPTNTHGNVSRAVSIGGVGTSVQAAPGNKQPSYSLREQADVDWLRPPSRPQWTEGLGLDLNGDGKFEAGKDGHLALDLDGNGVYDKKDIKDTLDMLKLFSGASPNSKGTPGFGGFRQADQAKMLLLKARGKQIDLNQDGVLSSWELTKAGGKALVGAKNASGKAGTLQARSLPGAYTPDYAPRMNYYSKPPMFGGYSPYSAPMSFGPPAYFMQVMQGFMGFFARPY